MMWDLPESVEVGGEEWDIRSDFRAALDIITVMADNTVSDEERALVCLTIFYPDFGQMRRRDYDEALQMMSWFIDGGEKRSGNGPRPRLMDWEQDFPLIVAPVNRVLGYETREREHVHWWTFLGAYMEIGDCLFANVVSTRRKKAQGKMDKVDRDFYKRNKELVDFRADRARTDDELIDEWI